MKLSPGLQVVILAAGKGVRMRSALPKVLHRVCGLTILERVLRTVSGLEPKKIIVVVGHGEALVREELNRIVSRGCSPPAALEVVVQHQQLGTGHAVQQVLPQLDDTLGRVLILPGDIPLLKTTTLAELFRDTAGHRGTSLDILTCAIPVPKGYGRIVRSPEGNVERIIEEADCTPEERRINEVNSSIYLSTKPFLERALSTLDSSNAKGELYLTDVVAFGVREGFQVRGVQVENYIDVLGANSRYELNLLESLRRKEIAKELMDSGVSFEDPKTVYIDEDVTIAEDVFIGAGTRIQGRSRIEGEVQIEGDTLIRESEISRGALIKLGCYIDGARIGDRCIIGPFAHLRPGSVLESAVKIGNFVETKAAVLKTGVKANHLAYLGDVTVGADSNIGAGTITCNYDGTSKYATIIEEGVFIGSNSSLVAPVRIGKHAYVGAGSVINRDVPEQALGIARAKQTVIEGWALRKRKKKSADRES